MSEKINNNNGKLLKEILSWLKAIGLGILLAVIIKYFLVDLTAVSGRSMIDTLHDGDILLVNKISEKMGTDYQRGDIVIVKAPYEDKLYIKRVIGLPGENVELKDGYFYIDGKKLEEDYLPQGLQTPQTSDFFGWFLTDSDYFIVGDNRLNSNDSRNFGPVDRNSFVGEAFLRVYPFDRLGKIR